MSQNLSETQFHNGYKVCFNSTTLKLADLLRESGDIVVTTQLHVLYLMLNLQEGDSDF